MTKRISKIDQFKKAKQAERKMHAARMDWYLMQIHEAHEADNQHEVSRCDSIIRDCELKMHQLKKFI